MIAQSVEHAAVNRSVVGSSPTQGVKHFISCSLMFYLSFHDSIIHTFQSLFNDGFPAYYALTHFIKQGHMPACINLMGRLWITGR